MSPVTIPRRALRDLDEIWEWIARDSPENAQRFIAEITNQFHTLRTFPKIGTMRPDLAPGIRIFPFRDYVVYYRETRRGVRIVRILHGARDAKRILS